MSGMYDVTASVYSRTLESDGAGGSTEGWTLSGTIQCRLWLKTENSRELGGVSEAEQLSYICCCPLSGVEIADTDQLRIDGAIYAVRGVHIVAGHHRKMFLTEQRPEL